MSQSPEEIRAEIERTRANLSADVDELSYEANPSTQAHRQVDKVKGAARSKLTGVKEGVFGAAQDVSDRTGSATSSVSDAASAAPDQLKQRTRGNPLAAGLVAFGVGALAAALLPTSRQEQDAAQQAKAKAAPVVDDLKGSAQDMASELKQPAQQAAQSVGDTAKSGAEEVRGEAQGRAQDVKGQAQGAAQDVRDEAQGSAQQMRDQRR